MAAPAAADLQVPRREPLLLESAAAGERDRGEVAGLDVGLPAVPAEGAGGLAGPEPDRLGHVSLARVRGDAAVAEERALERAADDLGDVQPADDLVVGSAAGQIAELALAVEPRQVRVVGLGVQRRVQPRTVRALAGAHG